MGYGFDDDDDENNGSDVFGFSVVVPDCSFFPLLINSMLPFKKNVFGFILGRRVYISVHWMYNCFVRMHK